MKFPKPFETPKYLNRLHSHAKGLKASFLFNGTAKTVFDCTRNGNNLSVVNATWESDPDIGRGLLFDANGEYASLDNTGSKVVNSTKGTIMVEFKSLGSFDDSTTHTIFGKYGASSESGDFVITKYNNNYLYLILRGSSERYIGFLSPKLPTWTEKVFITMLWDIDNAIYSGQHIACNINGVHVVPDASSAASSWGSYTPGPTLYIGNDSDDTANHANGIITDLRFFDEVLEENAIKSIYMDKYEQYYA